MTNYLVLNSLQAMKFKHSLIRYVIINIKENQITHIYTQINSQLLLMFSFIFFMVYTNQYYEYYKQLFIAKCKLSKNFFITSWKHTLHVSA